MRSCLDLHGLDHLLSRVQDGIVCRRQILELGGTDNDIERMLRRRDLAQVYVGVYVNHTGRLTRRQQEWAAVLAFWPAALTLESALPGHQLDVVKVAVALTRRVQNLPRVWVYPTSDLHQRTDGRATPPAIALEHATIDVMSCRIREDDVAAAFATLTQVCHTRRTTPERIASVLGDRVRVAGRPLIRALLDDQREGACSVLERGYLELVERAHGLPRGRRQRASNATGRRTYQDVHYEPYGVIVEPDGLAWHDGTVARDADARRDLSELAVSSALTARVTHGLVFREGCWTAAMVAALLIRQGWTGPFRRCPRCPPGLMAPKA